MKTIYKYSLIINDEVTLQMPIGSEILSVQTQYGIPNVWALVDPEEKATEVRTFVIRGTGHPVDPTDLKFLGTIQMSGGALVFHVFEKLTNVIIYKDEKTGSN